MNILLFTLLVGVIAVQEVFKPSQTVATGKFLLDAPVTRVFSMFEPIGEKRWSPGWNPQAVFPDDIKAAEGTVFTTEGSKGPRSIWTIVRYVPNKTIEYSVVTPDFGTTQLVVACKAPGASKTEVTVTYRITGLSEKGNKYGRDHKGHFAAYMEHWREHISQALKK